MNKMSRLLVLIALIVVLLPLSGQAAPPEPPKSPEPQKGPPLQDVAILAKVDPFLLKEFDSKDKVTFLVYFRQQADTTTVALRAGPAKVERRVAVYEALRRTAQQSQAGVRRFLSDLEARGQAKVVNTFITVNALAVTADQATMWELAKHPEVARVGANHVYHLPKPIPVDESGGAPTARYDLASAEWNIRKIRAPDAWNAFGLRGEGIVVANMDTGVFVGHPALAQKYRGYTPGGSMVHDYNWFDATGQYPTAPADGHGHGTHTMGTIVGSDSGGVNEIGVAPGARWIAVKVFTDSGDATTTGILAGFDWLLAPTDLSGQHPDPSKAPDVVSNSWGSDDRTDYSFYTAILNLRNAGIFTVFAAGNAGPSPATVGTPALFTTTVAVGATDINDLIAGFSSRGPAPDGRVKPDVSAPGVSVRSAVPFSVSSSGYASFSGTSMATPHVAGLAALIYQARPSATIDEVTFIITSTARPLPPGGSVPNNDYGWGRIDAYQAMATAVNGGSFRGRVTDVLSGQGIPNARILMTNVARAATSQTLTDASGYYSFTVAAGLYDVAVSHPWYEASTVSAVDIITSLVTLLDFQLTPKEAAQLMGTVTEYGTGQPVTATITLEGLPISTTTAANGFYSLTVPLGTYNVRVRPGAGHRQGLAASLAITQPVVTRNFALASIPRILLVDADYFVPASQIAYYQEDLDTLLYSYDTWTIANASTDAPPASVLQSYDIVVWSAPLSSPGYVNGWPALGTFLDGGGRLFISGQDVGYHDVERGRGASAYRQYLHAIYQSDDVGLRSLSGQPDSIFQGITLTLNTTDSASNQFFPDKIAPADAQATTVLSYTGPITTSPAALQIQTPTYRALYFSFGYEGSGPAPTRRTILDRSIAWLTLPSLILDANRATVSPGGTLVYTLTLQHNGGYPLLGTAVYDPIPANVTFVPGSTTGGAVFNSVMNRIEWMIDLSPHSTYTATFAVQLASPLPGGLPITNTATVDAGLAVPGTASLVTLVGAPNLSSSSKTASAWEVALGNIITYTVTLSNTGPGDAHVTVVDPLPSEVRYITGTATNGATYDPALNRIEWNGVLSGSYTTVPGYALITSDQPGGPSFSWVDISSTGTRLSLGDDETTLALPIGFTFPYYGQAFTQFYLSSNGWVSFSPPTSSQYTNKCLPSPEAPPNLIAMWWDDLNPQVGGDIFYWSNGIDTLVISFLNVPHFSGGGSYTFQAILRANGQITLQYLNMSGELGSATVGIQDASGTQAVQFLCNQSGIHDNLAVLFSPPVGATVASFSFQALVVAPPVNTVITNTAFISESSGLTGTLTSVVMANTVNLSSSTKKASATEAGAGDVVTYTIAITNTGTISPEAISIALTDVLPAGLTYISGSVAIGSYTGEAIYDPSLHAIIVRNLSIHRQGTITVTYAVRVDSGLTPDSLLTNTAYIDDAVGTIHRRSAVIVYREPDLSSSALSISPVIVPPGQLVTMTLRVINTGRITAQIMATSTLPARISLDDGPFATTGTVTYESDQRILRWAATIPPSSLGILRARLALSGYGPVTIAVDIRDNVGRITTRHATISTPLVYVNLPVILHSDSPLAAP